MAVTYQSALFADFFEQFSGSINDYMGIPKYYQFGDKVLEVKYLHQNIQYFGQSIAHLEIAPCISDFKITVVSNIDTGIHPPDAFWTKEIIGTDGVITSDTHQYVAHYNSISNFFQIADNVNSKAIYWFENEDKIPDWERSFSFRWILHHFTEPTKYCMLHAASLGCTSGGVILPAKSGSGKSNTSLACIGTSVKYMGDDFVLIDTESLTAYSLYNCAKIEYSRVAFFPSLASTFSNDFKNDSNTKSHIYLYPQFKNFILKSFKIKAILIPQFMGNLHTEITITNAIEGLKAMAPTTIGVLKATNNTFKKMAHLSKRLPNYYLKTGTSLEEIPKTIESLLLEL